jgi:UDP-N-acetylmuramate dehydrogenase
MKIDDLKLVADLQTLGSELVRGTSLAELTYLGIGGTTDLIRIHRHDAIPDLLNLLDRQAVAHKFLGGGSNLLVIDGELPFVVPTAKPDRSRTRRQHRRVVSRTSAAP